eukprot:gene27721-36488_t
MSDAPSWLSEEAINPTVTKAIVNNKNVQKAAVKAVTGGTYIPPPVPGANDIESAPKPNIASSQSNINTDFDIDEKTLSQIKKAHLTLRLLYMTTAILLGLAAGLTLQKNSNLGIYDLCSN